ncbi:Exodeoxyribonuclease I [Buchnera aphidicola (Pterocallis alni)]|uniref:exodeoxyribonuclease I n=1 Tax=Buchnera aphidicola TaxID=9 RepID=UPI0034640D9F
MNTYTVNKQEDSFLFYDYETFGVHTALDKPCQFACIRTNLNLYIVNKPKIFYCYPPTDYLPNPISVLTNGITPELTLKYGMNEFFFSEKIYNILNCTNTCIVGYNNINFDDEITRNIFYRNFLDPYTWSWKNNNSRIDLMYIIIACYALSPTGINWLYSESRVPSFKLVDLTKCNNIIHNNAHTALSDVYATINLFKLIKYKKPKLLNFFLKYRFKNNIKSLINIINYVPLIYISGIFGKLRNYITCIVPLFWNNKNINMLFFFDLYMNPVTLIEFIKNTSIKSMTFKKLFKLGINFLSINKCPILIPIHFFTSYKLNHFGINITCYLKKIRILRKNIFLLQRVIFYVQSHIYRKFDNVDLQMYDAFFCWKDKKIMSRIHKDPIKQFKNKNLNFFDIRCKELFFKCCARNFYDLLTQKEKNQWFIHRARMFSKLYIYNYVLKVRFLMGLYFHNCKKKKALYHLLKYIIIFFFIYQ